MCIYGYLQPQPFVERIYPQLTECDDGFVDRLLLCFPKAQILLEEVQYSACSFSIYIAGIFRSAANLIFVHHIFVSASAPFYTIVSHAHCVKFHSLDSFSNQKKLPTIRYRQFKLS